MEALLKLFDAYNRKSRLYPAVIASLPVIWTALSAIDKEISFGEGGLVALATMSVFFFIATVARSRGKIVEDRLLRQWGGWPTTISLRHRDPRIDRHTKARYHASINRVLTEGLVLPTEAEEKLDVGAADAIYRSATKQFLELRRGPQYRRIHDENAWYGFRRNLRGLKWPSITVAVVLALVTAAVWLHRQPIVQLQLLIEAALATPKLPVLIGLDALFALAMASFVTDAYVRQAGYEYADALLRSIDNPGGTQEPAHE